MRMRKANSLKAMNLFTSTPLSKTIWETILKPMQWLVTSSNGFYKLEKDLVPLIEMDLEVSYHINEDSEEH